MSTIRTLSVDLKANTASFEGGMNRMHGHLQVFGVSMRETRNAGHLLGEGLNALGGHVGNLAQGMVGAATHAGSLAMSLGPVGIALGAVAIGGQIFEAISKHAEEAKKHAEEVAKAVEKIGEASMKAEASYKDLMEWVNNGYKRNKNPDTQEADSHIKEMKNELKTAQDTFAKEMKKSHGKDSWSFADKARYEKGGMKTSADAKRMAAEYKKFEQVTDYGDSKKLTGLAAYLEAQEKIAKMQKEIADAEKTKPGASKNYYSQELQEHKDKMAGMSAEQKKINDLRANANLEKDSGVKAYGNQVADQMQKDLNDKVWTDFKKKAAEGWNSYTKDCEKSAQQTVGFFTKAWDVIQKSSKKDIEAQAKETKKRQEEVAKLHESVMTPEDKLEAYGKKLKELMKDGLSGDDARKLMEKEAGGLFHESAHARGNSLAATAQGRISNASLQMMAGDDSKQVQKDTRDILWRIEQKIGLA